MFEQAFKKIDDVLWKDAGCTSELDYTEQSSWLLFLKYLDALEHDRAMEAELEARKYQFILDEPFRWEAWAAPKDLVGKLDHHNALTGDDLRDFVNLKLFPYLHGFKAKATGPNTIEYKIGEIFGEIKNKIQSGYNLREVVEVIDTLRFRSRKEKHELSHLYEAKIKNMGNAGRNGGEYYTPRPLIRAMIQVVQPRITPQVNRALDQELLLPARRPANLEALLKEVPELRLLVLDGVERPVRRPKDKDDQKKDYRGKKKAPRKKNLLISSEKRVVYLGATSSRADANSTRSKGPSTNSSARCASPSNPPSPGSNAATSWPTSSATGGRALSMKSCLSPVACTTCE